MESEERDFYYDKGNYLWKLKPNIEKYHFEPKLLIQFGLVLPYFIPFPEKHDLTYGVNSEEVCHFLFTSLSEKQTMFSGVYKNDNLQVDIKRTRVEVTYCFKKFDSNFMSFGQELSEDYIEDKLTDTFDKSLNKLNNVIKAYLAKTSDEKVYKLTKEHLDMAIITRISDGKNYKRLSRYLFSTHMNAPNISPGYLSPLKLDEVMHYIEVIEKNLNPFISGNEFMIDADRNFSTGNYKQAIIHAQTSVEIFMFTIYREFLKSEGYNKQDVSMKSKQMKYKSLVMDQFHKRIGGNFNIEDINLRVGMWWSKTYLLRNNIVHEGYTPSFKECDGAIFHARDVIDYILELIKNPQNQKNILI